MKQLCRQTLSSVSRTFDSPRNRAIASGVLAAFAVVSLFKLSAFQAAKPEPEKPITQYTPKKAVLTAKKGDGRCLYKFGERTPEASNYDPKSCGQCGNGKVDDFETPESCPADYHRCGNGKKDGEASYSVLSSKAVKGQTVYYYETITKTESCDQSSPHYCHEDCAPKVVESSDEYSGQCPPEMAQVDNFCIDRWEVHLVYEDGRVHPREEKPPKSMKGLKAVSASGFYPQGYMSQNMAKKACRAAGKYLCTLDEWKKTCRGPYDTDFPYGNEYKEGVCHVGQKYTVDEKTGRVTLPERPHILDLIDPPPENPMLGVYKFHHAARTRIFNDPRAALEEGYLLKTGTFRQCVVRWNGREVYDIVGNLSEWTSTKKKGKAAFGGDGHSGTARRGCRRTPIAHNSDYHDYSTGARCCERP